MKELLWSLSYLVAGAMAVVGWTSDSIHAITFLLTAIFFLIVGNAIREAARREEDRRNANSTHF